MCEIPNHIVLLTGGLNTIQCRKCGAKYNFFRHKHQSDSGLPRWIFQGMIWGFAQEHADCEETHDHDKD